MFLKAKKRKPPPFPQNNFAAKKLKVNSFKSFEGNNDLAVK